MVFATSLLNTQHHNVLIKGKVKQSSVVAIEKGAFELPSTTVTTFTYLIIFKSKTKKVLLSVMLFAVIWVPYVLKHCIFGTPNLNL